ncbi:MAG: sodium:calcium antiporter [Ktedonobacterales bacterium]
MHPADILLLPALFAARLPDWALPALVFLGALLITLNAAARYTRLLEGLSDYEHLSSELLGFLSALGANIPNYVASLAAFLGGHGLVGFGIIVGSNIYNAAVILGVAAFAAPNRRGIILSLSESAETQTLAWLAAAMGGTTFLVLLTAAIFPSPGRQVLLTILNLVILALFGLVVRDALRPPTAVEPGRYPAEPVDHSLTADLTDAVAASAESSDLVEIPARSYQPPEVPSGPAEPPGVPFGTILLAMLALGIALVGVIIMVRAGQTGAADLHLSPIILSVVVLAVATSLPNTVVAYQLARTGRASTCVEEILSSNTINLALGSALPLLFWPIGFQDGLLIRLDVPLLCLLGLAIVAIVHTRRIPRWAGVALFGVYIVWVAIHISVSR